jgi:hypothetical protein
VEVQNLETWELAYLMDILLLHIVSDTTSRASNRIFENILSGLVREVAAYYPPLKLTYIATLPCADWKLSLVGVEFWIHCTCTQTHLRLQDECLATHSFYNPKCLAVYARLLQLAVGAPSNGEIQYSV